MKKVVILFAVPLMILALCGFGGSAPEKPATSTGSGTYMIDDFERGSYKGNPEWWVFDKITPQVVGNSGYQNGEDICLKEIKNYSLSIAGNCTDWYCGGMGTYIAKKGADLSQYNAFQMDVYGGGPGSGTIKIELYDDDKGIWAVEQDPTTFVYLSGDVWTYSLIVDWKGWKRVAIPISDFNVDNPGNGDGVYDAQQKNGSGGLLQIQLISVGPKKLGSVKYNIDNVSLSVI